MDRRQAFAAQQACVALPLRSAVACVLLAAGSAFSAPAGETGETDFPPEADLFAVFARDVDRRLEVPAHELERYVQWLDEKLQGAGLAQMPAQHVFMVDRSAAVQAGFLFLRTPTGTWDFIGATQVSTGLPGTYEHFVTPTGVFEHSLANPDFRSEGTQNDLGVRGYGRRGMRVFDFGWVLGQRGWGSGGTSPMRLQVHATDPDLLEPRLGRPASKGCIRIPASLDDFLDRRGVLDADYLRALERGEYLWMIRADRQVTRWPGRYLVIVDSERRARPEWAARPHGPARIL
jgi:hypothetical protein